MPNCSELRVQEQPYYVLRKKDSKTDWKRVQRDAAADVPITYDPDADLYDPNDSTQVQNFFASAKVVGKPGRPKAATTKIPTAIRLSSDVVEYFFLWPLSALSPLIL